MSQTPTAPQTRANSFNYVRTETTVARTADAGECTAHAQSGGVDPARQLWLGEADRLARYVTDTGDFINGGIEHLFAGTNLSAFGEVRAGLGPRHGGVHDRPVAGDPCLQADRPRRRAVVEPTPRSDLPRSPPSTEASLRGATCHGATCHGADASRCRTRGARKRSASLPREGFCP